MNQVTRKFPLRKHDFLDEFLARISHEDSCNRLSRGLDGALLAIRAAIWARRQVGRAER